MAHQQPTQAEIAEFMKLKAENEALKAKLASRAPTITAKVSKSGGISLYGMGKFPVTLFPEQWVKVLADDVSSKIMALVNLDKSEFERLQGEALAKSAANPYRG